MDLARKLPCVAWKGATGNFGSWHIEERVNWTACGRAVPTNARVSRMTLTWGASPDECAGCAAVEKQFGARLTLEKR